MDGTFTFSGRINAYTEAEDTRGLVVQQSYVYLGTYSSLVSPERSPIWDFGN